MSTIGGLSNTMTSILSLGIHGRIPVTIIKYNSFCTCQQIPTDLVDKMNTKMHLSMLKRSMNSRILILCQFHLGGGTFMEQLRLGIELLGF